MEAINNRNTIHSRDVSKRLKKVNKASKSKDAKSSRTQAAVRTYTKFYVKQEANVIINDLAAFFYFYK
jgi:hypothetical protein